MANRIGKSVTAGAVLGAVVLVVALAGMAEAQNRRRDKAPPPPPGDKRDRVVALAGSPFHGRPYWQALGQCGGIYFKLASLYNEAGILARIEKRDAAGSAELGRKSAAAGKSANAFFDAAERVLIADRGGSREEAILTYDAKASEAGDGLKSVDAATQAAKPCPALYQTCREALAKICGDTVTGALTRRRGVAPG
jgi:hypothetical protein